jgi:hypothetical protein
MNQKINTIEKKKKTFKAAFLKTPKQREHAEKVYKTLMSGANYKWPVF